MPCAAHVRVADYPHDTQPCQIASCEDYTARYEVEETYYVDEIDAVLSKLNTKIIYTLHVHSLITIITVVIVFASFVFGLVIKLCLLGCLG